MESVCFAFSLLLGSLNLTTVPVPFFNESFLGVHAFNLTCTDIVFGSSGADWVTNATVTSATSGGSLHCYANLTAYAYNGLVHADIAVAPSNIVLSRAPLGPNDTPDGLCYGHPYVLDSCAINAVVTDLHADPPSRLVDMALQQLRASLNANVPAYICDVLVPRMQKVMESGHRDLPLPRTSPADRTVYPLSDSSLAIAAVNAMRAALENPLSGLLPSLEKERMLLAFPPLPPLLRFARSLVGTAADKPALQWLQGVVDAVLDGSVPDPFAVYGLPGEVSNLSVNSYLPGSSSDRVTLVAVDATLASCDDNACEVYLHPGVEIVFTDIIALQSTAVDSVVEMMTSTLQPLSLPFVNAKIATVLRDMAVQQQRNVTDPDATVRVTFGKKAQVRATPKVWPLVIIALCSVVGGGMMIQRNQRLHGTQPVLSVATGEPVAASILLWEDVAMVVGAAVCLLLFASSNTMTGASVLLGETLNTYSFSMWNTVTDLWSAGLIPLSVCVFVFSGIYPYVKLLSLVYFTVWAQRPLSKRLALIDVLGKFSFIDTFALMVMVSGLEIRNVAHVVIHRGFYYFMFATVFSIMLGNFATTLYRRGTSHRVSEEGTAHGTAYERVAADDNDGTSSTVAPPPPPPPAAAAPAAPSGEAPPAEPSPSMMSRVRRLFAACAPVLPCIVVHQCSFPAWKFGCLRYTVGGLARVLTPAHKTLSLWQLSLLDKWGTFQREDAMVCSIFAVSFFTIMLAPCIFVLAPRRGAFLASWCAADVFIVACVAGLLQLHQFVTFVLGEGMDDVYTAHATLLWPMLPLTIASLTVWYLIVREIFGAAWFSKH